MQLAFHRNNCHQINTLLKLNQVTCLTSCSLHRPPPFPECCTNISLAVKRTSYHCVLLRIHPLLRISFSLYPKSTTSKLNKRYDVERSTLETSLHFNLVDIGDPVHSSVLKIRVRRHSRRIYRTLHQEFIPKLGYPKVLDSPFELLLILTILPYAQTHLRRLHRCGHASVVRNHRHRHCFHRRPPS